MNDKTKVGLASGVDGGTRAAAVSSQGFDATVASAGTSGIDATVAAGSSPPSGVDATVAAGSSPPSGIEATLAPDGSMQPAVTIRAGRRDDYDDLLTIERQHYVVGDEIARGGMGRILAARDRRLGRPVAIKELLIDSVDLRMRFEREARITAKLQHPSIVNILEAGEWPSGEAFYVMKLVTGESLDKVIAARPTLDQRLALLPNVIATVDALAYAHEHRVIHRDLKPANVLVGDFGETVVIDWGLAKDLADTSEVAEVPAGPYRIAAAAPGETMAGAVMGTPAYMPVEQARGEAVDERADVYALGAMLYHVLAGEPPFTGRSADAILAQVIADEVVPLDRRLTGVPPDLVTIVSKAMAKSAADRYPTAKQLAEDLKQFQTGQLVGSHRYSRRELLRRWVRRHRGAVTVGASLAVVLLVSSTLFVARIMSERDEANHQRTDAIAARDEAKARGEETQRRRVAAETLIDQLVFQLKEKLLAVGKLEVLTDLAQPISKYYDAVGEGEREPLALRRRAEAQDILGEIAVSQGKLDEAAARFDAAQHVLDQIDAPTPEVWNSRGKLLEKYGDLEQTRGSVAKAREYYDQALVADRKYLAARPTDPKAIRNVGAEISKLGELDTQTGHYDDALRHFRETRELLLPLARAMPDDTGRAQDLATVERKLAEVLGYQGKLEDAGASLMAAKELDERALAQHPGDAVLMRLLAIDQSLLAENLSGRGRAREVVAMSAGAVTQFERIVALDPSNVDRQRDLEVAYNNTGELMLTLGDRAAAMSVFRKGMAIAEQVYKKMPAHRVVIADLAFSLDKVGNMYRLARSYGEAADAYARAAKLNDQVLAASPKDHEAITNLAGCHVALGDISMARGDRAAAATAFRTALATRERLAADDANGAVDRAADHVRIGTALDPRDGPAARAEYEQGLELATAAAARWPAVTLASKIAATAHTALGTSSALAVPLRIQHLEAAVAGYEKLQKAEPLDELSRAHLAEAAQTLTRLRTR